MKGNGKLEAAKALFEKGADLLWVNVRGFKTSLCSSWW
jgi:hypothetical protein